MHEKRAVGAYLGMAVGDALGATVEFMTPGEIAAEHGVHREIRGGGWLKLKPGQVTDDTEMALALGEAILETGHVEARSVATAFSEWMKRKPVDIGNTVRRGIIHYRHSGEPYMAPSEHDAGNGACMRCLPVALATYGKDESQVQQASRIQAHVTHNNVLSDAATECVIVMIHAALDDIELHEHVAGPVRELVEAHPEFRFRGRRRDNPSGYIVETMQAVFQALFETDNFEDCLVDVVNRGGDADTTGAIAGMIAGACYGVDAIPKRWLEAVNPSVYAQCEQQARALLALARREKSVATEAKVRAYADRRT